MDTNIIKEFLNEKGPVAKLANLELQQIISLLRDHVQSCESDHSDTSRGVPQVSEINFLFEHFVCKHCGGREFFEIRAESAISYKEYLCRLLRQAARFNEEHFKTCAPAEGGAQ